MLPLIVSGAQLGAKQHLANFSWAFLIAVAGSYATATCAAAQPKDASCATCHLALGIQNLTKPAEDYKSDIHAAKGFGCAACHGGDPSIMGLEGMDRKK